MTTQQSNSPYDENGVVRPPPDSRYVLAVCNPKDWSKGGQVLVSAYFKDGKWHIQLKDGTYFAGEPADFYVHWWVNLYKDRESKELSYA